MNLSRYFCILILTISFFIIGSCSKISQYTDESLSEEDIRTESLLDSYEIWIFTNPDSVRHVILKDLKTIHDSTNYYLLQRLIAICHYTEGNTDSSSAIIHEIFRYCKKKDLKRTARLAKLEAATYVSEGVRMGECGLYDSSSIYTNQAINILRDFNAAEYEKVLPDYYLALSNNYTMLGKYPEAVRACNNALLLIDSLGLTEDSKYGVYVKLARNYLSLKNYKLADEYFKLTEQKEEDIDVFEKYNNVGARGEYYMETKEYDKAILYFKKGCVYAEESGIDYLIYPILGNISECFLNLGKLDSAQFYIDKTFEYHIKYKDIADPGIIYYVNLLYADLCVRKNELGKAESILSENACLPTTGLHTIYMTEKNLEALYNRKGDYKKAYEHRIKADILGDSIQGLTVRNQIAEIELRYQQDTTIMKRDILIAQKDQKVQEFRNVNLSLILLLTVLVLSIIIAIIYIRRRNEQRYSLQMATVTKLRMENVRKHISPHFIFNVLNSLVPGLREHEDLNRSTQLLMKSIRNSLLISEELAIPLKNEMDIVNDYVELRKNMIPNSPDIHWKIAGDVNLDILIPSMTLQVPIENALKYAFEDSNENKQINIEITRQGDYLSVFIEDNGVGFDPQKQVGNKQGTGSGLKILYRTIELLNTKNQNKIKFVIQNKTRIYPDQHGTEVQINIPVNYRYDI